MTISTRLFCFSACIVLLLRAAAVCSAQDAAATPSPNQLTAEQKASLGEALQLTRNVLRLHEERKFDEALPLAHRAVELRRSVLGENNPLVADAMSNLGGLYIAKQNYERAEGQFRKALSIYENAGTPTANMAYALDTLTLLRWSVRDHNKAEDYGKRALALKAELFGEQTVQFFSSVDNLLKVYEGAGRTSARNALILRALSIVEKTRDRIPDRQALFRYHCSLRQDKQASDVVAMLRQIEALLAWNPSAQSPLTGGVLNGRAVSLPRPPYPREARLRRASGQVVVQIVIDECGNVIHAKALSGDSSLRVVSESAAMAARFTPTSISGTPVKVTGVIQYNFVNQGAP